MTRMRKPMLSVTGLIEHMQSKNITFNIMTVDWAKEYLEKNNNYFKLTSYRKNYSKFTSGKCEGQYENLDFAFLIELARIDVLHMANASCSVTPYFAISETWSGFSRSSLIGSSAAIPK